MSIWSLIAFWIISVVEFTISILYLLIDEFLLFKSIKYKAGIVYDPFRDDIFIISFLFCWLFISSFFLLLSLQEVKVIIIVINNIVEDKILIFFIISPPYWF